MTEAPYPTEVRDLLRNLPRHPWHPILGGFRTDDELLAFLMEDGAAERYEKWFEVMGEKLRAAEDDPLYGGLPLDCWALADEQLADPDCDIQVNFGWNRGGGKTWRALKLLCESARTYPSGEKGVFLVLGETEDSSQNVQQAPVWTFLKKYIKHLNGREDKTFKVVHKEARGFTEGLLVIPADPYYAKSGKLLGYRGFSVIQFDTYKGDPGKYEGREFGARRPVLGQTPAGNEILDLQRRPDGSVIQNIGVVADEGLNLAWFKMLQRRIRYRAAKMIWSYTPIHGLTPAIKEVVGTPAIERTAPVNIGRREFANFVADVKGCPPGHMPVTATCGGQRTPPPKVVWFHLSEQSFNNYYEKVKADCQGKTLEYIERYAYGYARDSVAKQFSNFGPWNIIDEEQLPSVGTDFQIVDWHERKPPFCIWGRVVPGELPSYYIWADWPDAETHGEWAVPTQREVSTDSPKGWDGDNGPAQATLPLGLVGLKKVWRAVETDVPAQLRSRGSREGPKAAKGRIPIAYRIIDSRAGPRVKTAEEGQTCAMWELAEDSVDSTTGETLEGLDFQPSRGYEIDLTFIKDLLEYRVNDAGKIVAPPRLFVLRRCKQVIWALENYTGKSGESGASKDPIDCLHYMSRHELIHIADGGLKVRRPGVDEEPESGFPL